MTTPTRLLALDVGTGTTDILVFEPDAPPRELRQARRALAHAGRGRPDPRGDAPRPAGRLRGPDHGRRTLDQGDAQPTSPPVLPSRPPTSAALSFADDLDRGDRSRRAPGRRRRGAAGSLRAGAAEVRGGDVDLDGPAARRWPASGVPTALHGRLRRRPGPRLQPERLQPRLPLRDLGARPGRRARRSRSSSTRPPRCRPSSRACGRRPASSRLCRESRPPTPARRPCSGALGDELADAVLVNVGNCHTICAVALDGRLAGVYEDHTNRLDGRHARGATCGASWPATCRATRCAQAGGHGAALGGPVPAGLPVLVTGPRPRAARRQLAAGELSGAVRRHDDDRPGRPHRRPPPPLRRLRTAPPSPHTAGTAAACRARAAAACRRRRRGRARTPGER